MSEKKLIKRNASTNAKISKRKMFTYSEESLRKALDQIRNGHFSIREISRQFGVPRATLQDRLHGRSSDTLKKTGPPPLMGVDGEKKIAQWTVNIAKCGFPVRKENLIDTVTKIARDKGILNSFKNKKPGIRWYKSFLKRHPEISLREAEGINKARAIVTEECVRSWFKDLNEFLENNNCKEIMENPHRIFNGDESGFAMCPKTGKVLAPRGWKNLYQIKTGMEKENITVLLVFNASGSICPPLVIFPYVRPPKALVKNMPENWILAKSESGWMRSDVFYEYICNDFNKWLNKNKIERPVILFIDGHRSHMTLPLSQFCEENSIILYALPPNTTHMLQPADVSVFRPLKQEWRNTVEKWKSKNANSAINKLNFCSIFQEALMITEMKGYITNGFRKCGLFPLNPDAVDYTKCVKNTLEKNRNPNSKCETVVSNESLTNEDLRVAEKVINFVKDGLNKSGINAELVINEIKKVQNLNEEKIKTTDVTQIIIMDDVNVNEQSTDRNELNVGAIVSMNDVNILNIDSLSSAEVFSHSFSLEAPSINTEIIVTEIVEEKPRDKETRTNEVPFSESVDSVTFDVIHTIPEGEMLSQESPNDVVKQFDLTNSGDNSNISPTNEFNCPVHKTPEKEVPCAESSSDTMEENLSPTTPFSKHLIFPVALEGRAETSNKKEKLPSAISCKEWRKYYEKKDEIKKKKIEDVRKRKDMRELNRQTQNMRKRNKSKEITNKVKKHERPEDSDTQKEKVKCSLCDEVLFSDAEEDSEKNIGCDICPRWYHLRCTAFGGMKYEDASIMDYACDLCK